MGLWLLPEEQDHSPKNPPVSHSNVYIYNYFKNNPIKHVHSHLEPYKLSALLTINPRPLSAKGTVPGPEKVGQRHKQEPLCFFGSLALMGPRRHGADGGAQAEGRPGEGAALPGGSALSSNGWNTANQ